MFSTEPSYMDRNMREAVEIELHHNNMRIEDDLLPERPKETSTTWEQIWVLR
jgi:hypothetical protein